MDRLTIDPADFSESAWAELYNACELMPRTYEKKDKAKPFKRAKGQIQTAVLCCLNKAEHIRQGGLGPESCRGENRDWAFDLDAAAEQLQCILEADEKVPCAKCGRKVKKSAAFIDKGEGDEAAKTFYYCSGVCRENH
jgi:hypothetical protein